jgi:hypothetical protein
MDARRAIFLLLSTGIRSTKRTGPVICQQVCEDTSVNERKIVLSAAVLHFKRMQVET